MPVGHADIEAIRVTDGRHHDRSLRRVAGASLGELADELDAARARHHRRIGSDIGDDGQRGIGNDVIVAAAG